MKRESFRLSFIRMEITMEIYIHIPFCVKKCKYCDFLSGPAQASVQEAYMEALCTELEYRSAEYQDRVIETIFIGGGTPSVVKAESIAKLMDILYARYCVSENAEISMEINPATVNADTFKIYRKAGINRLSIGLQSANDKELKAVGRIHNYEQFLQCYKQAVEAGFQNINVDIMSALPGQTLESYKNTLERVVGLIPAPEHISAYSLILEDGTPLKEEYDRGELVLADEEEERKMYELTKEFLLEYGYERYEISNYARPGKECKHNIGYWERVDYLGFGIGAASKIGNKRFRNTENREKYIAFPTESYEEIQELSMAEEMEETMFLGLRLVEGVSLEKFRKLFGVAMESVYGDVIKKHIAEGLLKIMQKEDEKYLCLTDKGRDVCNYVMSDFLEPVLF